MEEDRELEGGTTSHQTREHGENGSQSPRKKSPDDGQIANGTEEKVFIKTCASSPHKTVAYTASFKVVPK